MLRTQAFSAFIWIVTIVPAAVLARMGGLWTPSDHHYLQDRRNNNSVEPSSCSPPCDECEWCDEESGKCIPRRSCPCVECRPMHECVNGVCKPRNISKCPPCGFCQACDPFTGTCVPAPPCYPCKADMEFSFVPDGSSSLVRSKSSSHGGSRMSNIPSEECGYCLSRRPRACPPPCPYWEVCDPVSGQCVPDCNIKSCDNPKHECINGLCIEPKEYEEDCTETPCREYNFESGRCELSQKCPLCMQCPPGYLCIGQADGGHCQAIATIHECHPEL